MSNSSSPIEASLPIRIFGGVSYALFSTAGLALNILLIAVFLRSRSAFERNAFYTIAWQLIICDVITHLMEFLVPIPITFAGVQIYGTTLFLYGPCFLDTIAYNGTLFFSFLMTLNRFTVFLLPKVNVALFHKPRLYWTIGCVWLFVVVVIVCHNIFACYKAFSHTGFYYHHVCPPNFDDIPLPGKITKLFLGCSSKYLPITMFIFYVLMIVYIFVHTNYELVHYRVVKKKTASDSEKKRWKVEISLLAQSFIICAFIELQNLIFLGLPNIPSSGQWIFVIDIVGNWVSQLLSSIHPIVLFCFNHSIRSRVRLVLKKNASADTSLFRRKSSSIFVSSVFPVEK